MGGPGGFAPNAELVVVTKNIVGAISATQAAAVIGNATSPYYAGQAALFAVDNGQDSALYLCTSSSADSVVQSSELQLLATLSGVAATTTSDFLFG